ncbi:MAG: hypothetical protein WCP69_01850 [Bacteroidota bacterium]
MTIIKKIKYLKKLNVLLVSLSVTVCFVLIMGIVYLSKINIYEDLIITTRSKEYSLKNIEIIGKSVFDKEVVLSNANTSSIFLENYYLNNLTLIIPDSVVANNILQLQINTNLLNVDLSKPDKTLKKQNYYTLNYTTNGNVFTKIGYVIKCNYVNISNIVGAWFLNIINIYLILVFVGFSFVLLLLFSFWVVNYTVKKLPFLNRFFLNKFIQVKVLKASVRFSYFHILLTILIFIFLIHLKKTLLEYENISIKSQSNINSIHTNCDTYNFKNWSNGLLFMNKNYNRQKNI